MDPKLIEQLRDALLANLVFHTPIALRRRGGKWDEYEIDAINRTKEALAAIDSSLQHHPIGRIDS